jgi:hypothetical protein
MFFFLNLREINSNFRGRNEILDHQVEKLSPTLKHSKGVSFINLREVNSKFSREKRNSCPQVEELSPTLKHLKGFPL